MSELHWTIQAMADLDLDGAGENVIVVMLGPAVLDHPESHEQPPLPPIWAEGRPMVE